MTKVGLSVMLNKKRYLSNYIEEELKVIFNILVLCLFKFYKYQHIFYEKFCGHLSFLFNNRLIAWKIIFCMKKKKKKRKKKQKTFPEKAQPQAFSPTYKF